MSPKLLCLSALFSAPQGDKATFIGVACIMNVASDSCFFSDVPAFFVNGEVQLIHSFRPVQTVIEQLTPYLNGVVFL